MRRRLVVVTTVPSEESSGDAVFTRFKQQTFSEQINGHLKGPLAERPVWLKSAKRIESLMFLMAIALMLHGLIQRTYRASLASPAGIAVPRADTLAAS